MGNAIQNVGQPLNINLKRDYATTANNPKYQIKVLQRHRKCNEYNQKK